MLPLQFSPLTSMWVLIGSGKNDTVHHSTQKRSGTELVTGCVCGYMASDWLGVTSRVFILKGFLGIQPFFFSYLGL